MQPVAEPLRAVHLHGFVPSLLAPFAMRASQVDAPIFHSPHSSKALGSWRGLGQLLWWVTRPLAGSVEQRGIANMGAEARSWSALSRHSAEVVETPVADAFFEVDRNEAERPLVVTGSKLENPRSAEVLCQVAVLLGGEDDGLAFDWLGAAEPRSLQRLKAAGVAVHDLPGDRERATRLATGWFYLAPGGTRGFPSALVEAMAAGLPCVAIDTPYHRELIVDGETGFLCSSIEEVIKRAAQLVESRALRQSLGSAARTAARDRFSGSRFRDSLFAVYSLGASRPMEL